jgi:hypothetical protein
MRIPVLPVPGAPCPASPVARRLAAAQQADCDEKGPRSGRRKDYLTDPPFVTPVPERPAMSLPSYSDVFAIDHDRDYDEEIGVGDLVRSGANHFPHFEVIAVHGDKAWVRNVANGADHLAPLVRCRRVRPPAAPTMVAE